METRVLERVKRSLRERRQNLANWLNTTPGLEKEVRLGPADETSVRAHVQVVDSALQRAEDGTLGLCEVCHEYLGAEQLLLDYTACVCIDHFSEEQTRELESELELSQIVQRSLLPHTVPDIPGLDLAVFSRPAQILGGDWFDFFQFQDGAHGLAIADVVGHGVSASLLMASVLTALRALVPESVWPSEVLQRVNRFFLHNIQLTTFVTMFLGRFDPQSRTLTYCNAGHNPPLVLRKNDGADSVSWLRPTGAAIGLVEEPGISSESITLAAGDTLLLYTDGITEALDTQGEEFGRGRLAELVQQEADMSARQLVEALRHGLQEFTRGRPLADDATIVACRIADGFTTS